MNAHSAKIKEIENYYKTSESTGLKREQVEKNRRDFGKNEITARKKKTVFKRFLEALSEPTLIILEFAWVITLGINVGKFVKKGVATCMSARAFSRRFSFPRVLRFLWKGVRKKRLNF